MNWEAIGAVAELLGAIGVIASLVYLASQIRHSREQMSHNTRALRAATYQQFREEIFQAYCSPVAIHGLSPAIRSGMVDFDQLDDAGALEFNFWAIGVMHSYDNAYYQYRAGMLDADRWEFQRSDVVGFVGMPGVVQWWRAMQPNLSPSFTALVSEILGEAPEA